MSRKNTRVDIPIGNVDLSIILATKIVAKHTDLGVASPLEGQVDVPLFVSKLTIVTDNRVPAVISGSEKEAWNEEALKVIGIGKGQNLQVPNTVYWNVNRVHKFLKFKYKGNEEQASLWGFNVVVTEINGKRNVNFNIPYKNAQGLLDLSAAIISKHTTDGVGSILTAPLFDMADFEAKLNNAVQLREDADAKDADSQAKNELARNTCGYGEGQNSQTPNTLYWFFTQVRDLLLLVHEGNEEQLSTWGFNVVTSESSSPGPGEEPEPVEINFAPGETKTLMENPAADEDIMLSVTGGPLVICTGPDEATACTSGVALNDGDSFDGTLQEFGLAPDSFLKATSVGTENVSLTFVEG